MGFDLLVLALIVGVAANAFLMYYLFSRTLKDNYLVYSTALTEMRAITQRVLVLRGLNPHVVDPEAFGPTGMARADEEKMATDAVVAQNAVVSAEDEALREAEEQFFAVREANLAGVQQQASAEQMRQDYLSRLARVEAAGGSAKLGKA